MRVHESGTLFRDCINKSTENNLDNFRYVSHSVFVSVPGNTHIVFHVHSHVTDLILCVIGTN